MTEILVAAVAFALAVALVWFSLDRVIVRVLRRGVRVQKSESAGRPRPRDARPRGEPPSVPDVRSPLDAPELLDRTPLMDRPPDPGRTPPFDAGPDPDRTPYLGAMGEGDRTPHLDHHPDRTPYLGAMGEGDRTPAAATAVDDGGHARPGRALLRDRGRYPDRPARDASAVPVRSGTSTAERERELQVVPPESPPAATGQDRFLVLRTQPGTRPKVIGVPGRRTRLIIGSGEEADIFVPAASHLEILVDLASRPPLLVERTSPSVARAGEVPLGDVAVPVTARTALLRIEGTTIDLGELVPSETVGTQELVARRVRANRGWQVAVGAHAACAVRSPTAQARSLATMLATVASPAMPEAAGALLRLGAEILGPTPATDLHLVVAALSIDADGRHTISLAATLPTVAWHVQDSRVTRMLQAGPRGEPDGRTDTSHRTEMRPGEVLAIVADPPTDVPPETLDPRLVEQIMNAASLSVNIAVDPPGNV